MVPVKPNHELNLDFLKGTFDLKKHVFINLPKHTRQETEGFSASQL